MKITVSTTALVADFISLLLLTASLCAREGIIIRIKVADISSMGRTTQGVTIMKMGDHDAVVSMARVAEHEHEEKEQKLFE